MREENRKVFASGSHNECRVKQLIQQAGTSCQDKGLCTRLQLAKETLACPHNGHSMISLPSPPTLPIGLQPTPPHAAFYLNHKCQPVPSPQSANFPSSVCACVCVCSRTPSFPPGQACCCLLAVMPCVV